MIVGGNGRGAIIGGHDQRRANVPFGRRFAWAADPTSAARQDVHYDNFEVTIADDGSGNSDGAATSPAATAASSLRRRDADRDTRYESPRLRATGSLPANAVRPVRASSSPNPAGRRDGPKLVADDGTAIDLIPARSSRHEPFIEGLPSRRSSCAPARVRRHVRRPGRLRGSVGYGRPGAAAHGVRRRADGARRRIRVGTGSALGGAMVMTAAAGALPAIAGNTSLYIGTSGAPGLDAPNGRSLTVRLARQAGDTKLRFSYRIVARTAQSNLFRRWSGWGRKGRHPATRCTGSVTWRPRRRS